MHKIFEIDLEEQQSIKAQGQKGLALKVGDSCIVQLDGWQDYGKVLSVYEVAADEHKPSKKMPTVVRRATYQDQSAAAENNLLSRTAQRRCVKSIESRKLNLHLLKVKYSFDRTRLFVLYSADEQLDMKGFLSDMAQDISAKIEARQLGVRDTAQFIGGMAPCGRQLCCKTWQKNFDNVYIKMAKNQGLSLNPSNINGMCGRLKCCLRFEDNCYLDLNATMPREGTYVETPSGAGVVVVKNILMQKVKVSLADRRILEFDVSQIKETSPKNIQKKETTSAQNK